MTIMWGGRFIKKTLFVLLLERRTENSPKKTLQMLILLRRQLQRLCDLATQRPVPQKCTFLDEK